MCFSPQPYKKPTILGFVATYLINFTIKFKLFYIILGKIGVLGGFVCAFSGYQKNYFSYVKYEGILQRDHTNKLTIYPNR